MEILVILFIVLIVVAVSFVIYEKIIEKKILSSSKKISELIKLNQLVYFHQLNPAFETHKHYDNKGSFNKIEPAYIMAAEIREKLDFFATYIKQINENRTKLIEYRNEVEEIWLRECIVDYSGLKILQGMYKKYENKLFQKNIISPVVDCTFRVNMTYSSPKGKVNLSKNNVFNFDDLFSCFESVSRSFLDRKTYSNLAMVERGEVSDSLRYDILKRDNFTCVICGASSKQGARLHIDHIVPVSKGGKSIPSNLRTLCERCNIGKSDKIETYTTTQPSETQQALRCNYCGAELVLRHGSRGNFYGCSNYPHCKYTRNINQ